MTTVYTSPTPAAAPEFDSTPQVSRNPQTGIKAAAPAVDVDALLNAAVDFEVFLNTPPEYEDQRKVREFRHDAYRKWEKFCAALRMHLTGGK